MTAVAVVSLFLIRFSRSPYKPIIVLVTKKKKKEEEINMVYLREKRALIVELDGNFCGEPRPH